MKFLSSLISSDLIAAGIGAIVISTFSYLFYSDITKKVDVGDAEQVGTISFKRKVAQRKYSSQVVWENIKQDTPVYNNDSIRTSDMSEAVIHLNDGTEIAVNENSMILLALGKDQINIEFAHGSMLAKRGDIGGAGLKKLNIKSGKATISIENSNVKLDQLTGKDLNLSVRKGSAAIATAAGAKMVNKNQKAVLSKDSDDVVLFKLNLKQKKPAPNTYFITPSDEKKIAFSWEKVKGENDLYLEISKDNSFSAFEEQKSVSGISKTIELDKGTYYWRLKAVNRITSKTDFSDSRRLNIIQDDPIQIISPENEEQFSYRTSLPIIRFKWNKSEIAKGYKLILSKDPLMKKILKTVKISGTSFVTDSLIKGNYYWKIEKVFGFKNITYTSSSKTHQFNILQKEIIEPPVLIYPGNNKRISRVQLEKQNITFTWKKNPQIRESRLYIAKDKKFEKMIFSSNSSVNFLQLNKDIPIGKYYWRVIGVIEDKELTAPSIYKSFKVIKSETIKLILPKQNAVLVPKENEEHASIRFSWRRSDIKGKYRLQISKDNDFSKIYKENLTNSNSIKITNIEPGRYYWKVALLDNDDSVLSKSNPLQILVKEKLDSPRMTSPGNGYVVDMSDEDALSLNWKNLDGANLYKISLYQVRNRKKYSILKKETPKNIYEIDDLDKLAVGTFLWTLQAFETDKSNKIVRKSPEVKSYFSITLGEPMEKLDIESLTIDNL